MRVSNLTVDSSTRLYRHWCTIAWLCDTAPLKRCETFWRRTSESFHTLTHAHTQKSMSDGQTQRPKGNEELPREEQVRGVCAHTHTHTHTYTHIHTCNQIPSLHMQGSTALHARKQYGTYVYSHVCLCVCVCVHHAGAGYTSLWPLL